MNDSADDNLSRVPDGAPDAVAFAETAKDLKSLREVVIDAAGVGRGLWFSYLFSLFYFFIATGGVTHRDLFLENPIKLPFLNVDLPLIGYFLVGPGLFLIIHAYVLLHFVLLAGKIGVFHSELHKQIADAGLRDTLRMQLPSNIFVQLLAGPSEVRRGFVGFMLRVVAFISLVLGPIFLLIFFQMQFLPYHDERISWWHRATIAADVGLLWTMWPRIIEAEISGLAWRRLSKQQSIICGTGSLGVLLLVFTVATFPGEWLHEHVPSSPLRFYNHQTLHELLVAGEIDLASRKTKSFWSNRLVVPGIDVVDHNKLDTEDKLAAVPETISLRARHLEGAMLIGAKLRKADFTGAILREANLSNADLRGANFGCVELRQSTVCTKAQGAIFNSAEMQGAAFNGASLQGASLNYAQLQGASFKSAKISGATLIQAQFQGALLDGADFGGAFLDGTGFQGASLLGADFRGALLYSAQLQGADLDLANFDGASLLKPFVWRVKTVPIEGRSVLGTGLELGAKYFCPDELVDCDWSFDIFDEFYSQINRQASPFVRQKALARFSKLNPRVPLSREEDMAEAWKRFIETSSATVYFATQRLAELQRVGCDRAGAPFVVRNFLKFSQMYFTPDTKAVLASAFLDNACSGAQGLSKQEFIALRKIADGLPADSGP